MNALINTLKFIVQHPLNRGRPLQAGAGFLRWQLGSRLLPGAVTVPFVEHTRLLVSRGMTGASGNIYCGLHEFEDMSLVLHALRPDDLFVDIGANVGAYSILAAGVCGAKVLSVEPIPGTFKHLTNNILINELESLICSKNIGLGSAVGEMVFTDALDTLNHVLAESEMTDGRVSRVPVETLDAVLKGACPCVIKMDVEGWETEVIKGASEVLARPGLLALLLELNGSGARYGFDEEALHGELVEKSFMPCAYAPFERTITALEARQARPGNTLYVRDLEALRQRVKTARKISVRGRLI